MISNSFFFNNFFLNDFCFKLILVLKWFLSWNDFCFETIFVLNNFCFKTIFVSKRFFMNLMQRQFGPESRRRDEVKFLGEIKITTSWRSKFLGKNQNYDFVTKLNFMVKYLLVTKKYFLVKFLLTCWVISKSVNFFETPCTFQGGCGQ